MQLNDGWHLTHILVKVLIYSVLYIGTELSVAILMNLFQSRTVTIYVYVCIYICLIAFLFSVKSIYIVRLTLYLIACMFSGTSGLI